MAKVTVYKQLAQNQQQGVYAQKPRGAKGAQPLVEKNRFVGEIDAGDGTEKTKFFGDSIDKLARTISLNIHDNGDIKVQNGTQYVIKDSKGDIVETKTLEKDEIRRFIELLKRALDNNLG